jgi:LPXTG-site transpeptidase (sortase) family protein
MNKKSLLRLILIAVVFVGMGGVGLYFALSPKIGSVKPVNTSADRLLGWKFPISRFPLTGTTQNQIAYSDIRDPGGIPQGLPVRLKIPVIGVNSAIEDALITPDGRMDVPAGSVNVAWFSLGPHPGQKGSAVIGGHYGIRSGIPFVFYKLDNLKIGDKIYIEDDKGDTLTFTVRSIKLFDREDDATSVFTSNDGLAHLNLITCEGIWNRVNDSYPERRVIFTDAVSGISQEPFVPIGPESPSGPTKAEDIAAFPRTFGMGATGADVIALQTFLEAQGFLTMPAGVAKGFFGTLTGAAVAKYQISAGLSPAGVFGPLTRAKFLTELGGDTGLPDMGPEKAGSQTVVQFLKSLYANPMDGLITLLLLIAITFVAFKIIRR